MNKKRKVILDCDPGHDDAVAIMLAAKAENIELLGISIAAGNQTLEKTTKNALHVLQALDIDVPVYVGRKNPLLRKPMNAGDIHGESGLDGPVFSPLTREPESLQAAFWIVNTIMNSEEKITVVTTGPMTNLGLALLMEPKIVDKVETFIFMGGSFKSGNMTPAAEFNILVDPEAAYLVFHAGFKELIMAGLDVSRKCLCLPDVMERMSRIDNKAGKLFIDMMTFFNNTQKKTFGLDGGPLHDPLTIAHLINPDLLKLKHVNGDVDISMGPSVGRTNCDMEDYAKKEKNIYVAYDVDVPLYWDIIEEHLRKY